MATPIDPKGWRGRLGAALGWVDDGLDGFERSALIAGILTMAGVSVVNVALRNLSGSSLIWANEVTQLLLVVVTFMGVGLGARQTRHIRVSAIHDLLPVSARKVLLIVTSTGTALLLLMMAGWAHGYAESTQRSCRILPESIQLGGLAVPLGTMPVAVAVALVLLAMALSGHLMARLPDLAAALQSRLPGWRRWIAGLVGLALLIAAGAWLAGSLAELVANRSGRCRVMSSIGLPVYVLHLIVPLGLLLGAMQFALAAVRNLISPDNYLSWRRRDEYLDADGEAADG
ncbi:TRAP transporter small permease [Wenzhouxiangella limi]|uniref:TRAP transporter small permease protein n=1 Tax=Wenzhouxiangella limi TaxID=2707351 RepID=A0A845UUZ8_9GAMM|nr:TRAP transporter small permease subunit [Wenzhouxiangella limi]NDY95663.1 TRAP transporter small permease [Wenzhouxiangella limi]